MNWFFLILSSLVVSRINNKLLFFNIKPINFILGRATEFSISKNPFIIAFLTTSGLNIQMIILLMCSWGYASLGLTIRTSPLQNPGACLSFDPPNCQKTQIRKLHTNDEILFYVCWRHAQQNTTYRTIILYHYLIVQYILSHQSKRY